MSVTERSAEPLSKLPPERLRRVCDPAGFSFHNTKEQEVLKGGEYYFGLVRYPRFPPDALSVLLHRLWTERFRASVHSLHNARSTRQEVLSRRPFTRLVSFLHNVPSFVPAQVARDLPFERG